MGYFPIRLLTAQISVKRSSSPVSPRRNGEGRGKTGAYRAKMEATFKEVGMCVKYFPYTKGTSSMLLSATLKKPRKEAS